MLEALTSFAVGVLIGTAWVTVIAASLAFGWALGGLLSRLFTK